MAYIVYNQSVYPQQINFTTTEYASNIIYDNIFAKSIAISEVLPFRVRFANIGMDPNPYNASNPAPIGIAIIGYSNYIL